MLQNKFEEIKDSISSLNTNINNSNNNNINNNNINSNNNNQIFESMNVHIIPPDHIVGNEGTGYRYQNESTN